MENGRDVRIDCIVLPLKPSRALSETHYQELHPKGDPRTERERAESLLDSLGTSRAARDFKDIDDNGLANGQLMDRQISRERSFQRLMCFEFFRNQQNRMVLFFFDPLLAKVTKRQTISRYVHAM